MAKLGYHEISGVSYDMFKSCLSNHNQYVVINGYDAINCGIPQESDVGPLLFSLDINELNATIKFCKVRHFADDTNLSCPSGSIKIRTK